MKSQTGISKTTLARRKLADKPLEHSPETSDAQVQPARLNETADAPAMRESTGRRHIPRILVGLGSIALLVLVWWGLASLVSLAFILPTPLAVAQRMWAML